MRKSILLATAASACQLTVGVHAQDNVAQPAPIDGSSASNQTADTEEATAVGDIVVTAQRRSQRLQDVGISIAAFSGEALKSQGITSSIEISRITPGVYQSGSVGGQSTQFSIRGVTQSDFSDVIEAPIAVYIDDGYVASQQGQTLALFDVERVEVLKGPQGTLFGRNATGGLVHFVVNKPTDDVRGYMTASYGRFSDAKIEAAVGGPIAEGVSGRASFFYHSNGDMWRNVYPQGFPTGSRPPYLDQQSDRCCQDLGNQRTVAGRLQLMFEPTSDLNIRITGSFADQELSTPGYTLVPSIAHFDAQGRVVDITRADPNETRIAIGPNGENITGIGLADPSGVRPVPGGDFFGFVPPSIQNRKLSNDFAADLNSTSVYTGALHINYKFGGVDFVSITDFKHNKKNFFIDLEGGPENTGTFGTRAKSDTLTQEFRFSGEGPGLKWVAGAYYLHVNATSVDGLLGTAHSYLAALFGMQDTGVDPVNDFGLKTRSISGFGQIEYEFAPKLTFVLGGRYIHEKQNYRFVTFAARNENDYTIDNSTVLFPLAPLFTDKRTKNLWAGKAQLEFRPSHGILTYIGVNRGVKAGAYNAKLPDGTAPLTDAQIPYKPETLTSYEAGFKATLAGGRLVVNGSAFYYDYKDYQVFTWTDVSGFVQNRDARTYGVDFQITAEPAEGLTASLGGSFLNAKVKDLPIAPGVIRDVKPSYTPGQQISARIAYRIPQEIAGGNLTLAVDGNYTSSVYDGVRNFSADKFDGYALVNGAVTWESREGWELTAYVKNIADKRYQVIGYNEATFNGSNLEAYGAPRTWGVSATYKF